MTIFASGKYLTEAVSFAPAAEQWAKSIGLMNGSSSLQVLRPSNNLSDLTDKNQARISLQLRIGADVQAFSSVLNQYASAPAPSSFSFNLLTATTKEQWRLLLGTASGEDFDIAGGTTGLTIGKITTPSHTTFTLGGLLNPANGGTGVTSLSALKVVLNLQNVDNTRDIDKPVSTAQAAAIAVVDTRISNLTGSNIPYLNGLSVSDALTKLLYTEPVINTLTVSPTSFEIGTTPNVIVSWSITGPFTQQKVNTTVVDVNQRMYTLNAVNATTTVTYALQDDNAPGGAKLISKQATITRVYRRYWGSSTKSALTSSDIITLSNSELNSTKPKTFSVSNGSTAKYVYYVYLASLGDPSVYKIFGYNETYVKTQVTVTTAAGAVLDYIVLRSLNPLSGNVDVETT